MSQLKSAQGSTVSQHNNPPYQYNKGDQCDSGEVSAFSLMGSHLRFMALIAQAAMGHFQVWIGERGNKRGNKKSIGKFMQAFMRPSADLSSGFTLNQGLSFERG